MRRFYVFLLAVSALCTFSAIVATSAFAATKFLANGAEITATLAIEIPGEITLHDLTNGAEVLCSGIFGGNITAGGTAGQITEVLDLSKVLGAATALNLALEEKAGDHIVCTAVKVCEAGAQALVVALKLPWAVSFDAATGELDLEPEYALTCRVLGFNVENTCGANLVLALVENDAVTGDALVEFLEAPELICENGDTANAFHDIMSEIKDPTDNALITVD